MRPQIVKILTLAVVFANSVAMFAQHSGPPAPDNQRRPPQGSIDDNIVILIVIGLVFGAFIAYKKYKTTNTPA